MKSKLLILDIDETLLHATEEPLELEHHFETKLYYVYQRPFLNEFLQFCIKHFKVAVWTTGGEEFAYTMVDNIFPDNYPLEFIWSKDRCTHVFDPELYQNGYLKNLKKVKKKGYRLEEVLMIDDTPSKLKKNYGNLVTIAEFTANQDDKELLRLMKYLEVLNQVENILKVEKRGWEKKYQV